MTARSTIRPLVGALLVLSLCAPVLKISAPAADRDRTTEFRALAAPSFNVLLTRSGGRYDRARQRPSAPSIFTLVRLHTGESDPRRLTPAVGRQTCRSIQTAGPRTGRSPPGVS